MRQRSDFVVQREYEPDPDRQRAALLLLLTWAVQRREAREDGTAKA